MEDKLNEKAHQLNEDFKKNAIVNPLISYLLGLSTVAPNNDILKAIESGISPIAGYNKKFTSPFAKQAEAVGGELRVAITETGFPAGINLDEPHTIVAGASNSGKTVCIEIAITESLRRGHKVWIFVRDDKITRIIRVYRNIFYEDFFGSLRLNPLFFLPKTTFVTLFKDSFTVYEGSESYILETLAEIEAKNRYPNLYDFYYFLKAKKESGLSRLARYKESIQNRLEGLLNSPLGNTYDCIRGHEFDIVKTNAIFNISKLTLPEQKFFVSSMINLLYLYNTGEGYVRIGA
jgi:hypothetical protein